jgi:hypothetical protein
MKTLTEALAERRRWAAERASEAVERLDGQERSTARQVELEEALADAQHYDELQRRLADLGDELGPYSEHSGNSLVRDLWNESRSPTSDGARRVAAWRRAHELERRDLGDSQLAAAIPSWVWRTAPTATTSAPFISRFGRSLDKALVISRPTITSPFVAAPQSGMNAAVSDDAVFAGGSVSLPVRTFGRSVLASLQLLEQAPAAALDRVLLPSLVGSVNAIVEQSVLGGDATGGHLTGLANTSGATSKVWTSATPTLAGAIQSGLEPTIRTTATAAGTNERPVVIMHPRRVSWVRERAVVEGIPDVLGPPTDSRFDYSLLGRSVDVVSSPGVATSGEVILVLGSLDALELQVGAPVLTFHPGASPSSTLTERITARRYAAVGSVLPASVGVVSGTGLAAPAT